MALFSLVDFVLFHFGLHRNDARGHLAAGVLWVTLLLAAVLGVNRLFVAEREQGGFDGFLLAPVDRTAMLAAKAAALFFFLIVLELIAVPAFALLLLGPPIGRPPGAGAPPGWPTSAWPWSGRSSSALAVQTRARDLIGPLLALPLLVPA